MEAGSEKIVANVCRADDVPPIQVEFFGLAREHAGVSHWEARVSQLSELLLAIDAAFPRFQRQLGPFPHSASPFRISLDGVRFLSGDERLPPGSKILILSADAGG